VSDQPAPPAGEIVAASAGEVQPGALDVFRNRPFLLLWLSQAFTQIGANMVMYGLTVIILGATSSSTAVSLLILTFLGPAVLFSAVAGVFVDRIDRRTILVVTNLLRAGAFILIFLAGGSLPAILLLSMVVSTITVFFAPAEAAMIPVVVPRTQLMAANGVFTLTLNAAFAVGFALLGPVVVTIFGAPTLIIVVAVCYLVAAGFCWTLPSAPPQGPHQDAVGVMVGETEHAVGSTLAQLREGVSFIRANPKIGWSLTYLGIAASLVGVLGVLGTKFATESLGLDPKDFIVVVLPLGFGIVTGILLLNNFGHLAPRRRIIEVGLVALGILLALLASAGPIARFLHGAESLTGVAALTNLTSLLGIVVAIALFAGIAYAAVAIPSQTQLQEDIPADARGRVFGILNMLVSTASLLPLLIVGPMVDLVGTTAVLLGIAAAIAASGIASIVTRGPLKPAEARAPAHGPSTSTGFDPVAVASAAEVDARGRRAEARAAAEALVAAEHAEAPPTEAGESPDAVTSANGEDAPTG
jgi:MFS family permease